MKRLYVLLALLLAAGPLAAQDTTQFREGVRVGVDYVPGTRPGLVVLPGPGLDSVRAMVRRDLDYSDRFEMIQVDDAPPGDAGTGPVNYGIYKTLGAQLAVELVEAAGGVTARLHDLTASKVRNQQTVGLPGGTDAGYRLQVHQLADELTRWASGTPGVAATRFLFVSGGRVYQVDSDGSNLLPLTPDGVTGAGAV